MASDVSRTGGEYLSLERRISWKIRQRWRQWHW